MKETDYLKLKKPDPVDFYDVQDFNDNADAIDEEFASLISDETIELFGIRGIDISGGSTGGDSGEDTGGDSGGDSGGSGEDPGGDGGGSGDSGEDAGGDDTIDEDDIATDEEVDEMIKDIFG